jgi:hypothetical protein
MPKIRISRREAERGLLPRVCVLTGEDTDDVKRRNFLWNPPWVAITILAGLLPYVIIALVTCKSMEIDVPLVRAKHGHWMWRAVVAWGLVLASLVLFFAGVVLISDKQLQEASGPLMLAGGVLFFLAVLIYAVLQRNCIHPTEITDRSITLVGVHQNFIDALEDDRDREEEEYQRKKEEWRARQREKGWDDEDDDRRPPRAKRPANRDDYDDRD